MRLLLLSDIHSNLEALEACLAAAPEYDLAVNLGDIVGYGASPNEVTECVRDVCKLSVRGNHDKATTGLMDLKDFNPVAGLAALWTRQQLKPHNLEWLRAVPQGPLFVPELSQAQFVHGSPVDEDEYVVTPQDAIEPLLVSPMQFTFFGHTHLQGAFSASELNPSAFRPEYKTVGNGEMLEFPVRDGQRYLVNPGSIGQPRDGDWRAAFALWNTDTHVVTFCRVPYDLKGAQERIMDAKLPPRLATRLAAGR